MRVIELGGGVAAAYTTRLFSEQGAEVVKVEPLGGDPLRKQGPFLQIKGGQSTGGLFHALNVNKRSVVLNMAEASGRTELRNLIAWADILVHSLSPVEAENLDIDPESVSAKWPALVVLSISPFGISGPYRDFAAQEITTANASGWAALCPVTFGEPEHPPLKVYGHHGSMMAATAAAMVGFATCREAQRSGVGEHIDFSIQAYLASVLEAGIPIYSYTGDILRRYHGHRSNPWLFCQTRDYPVLLMCVEEDQWQRLVEFMDKPDWADLEVFEDRQARVENQDLLHILLQDFFAEWQADELFQAAQAHRICCAPVLNYEQLSRDSHIRERRLYTHLPDHPEMPELMASPILSRSGRLLPRHPAPGLGQDSAQVLSTIEPRDPIPEGTPMLPLSGVRIVDLTWVWAGPYGSMNLAHLGAEVIRFESATRPDHFRRSPFYPAGVEPSLNSSGMFNQWNQGKSSVAVDLAKPEAIELVLKFVASSDVVIENFTAGVLDRLGLGYDELKKANPKIILASVSGYGQSGPYRQYMGYGPSAIVMTGLSHATGFSDGPPEEFGPATAPDPTGGITAAWGIVTALEKRDRQGEGDHLDISLVEASTVLGIEGWMHYALTGTEPPRQGNRDGTMAPHGCYPCVGDDEWVSIACACDEDWHKLATLIGEGLETDARFTSLDDRKQNEDLLDEIIVNWTSVRDRWEITHELQSRGIAAFRALSTADVINDPNLNEWGYIERLDHPVVGKQAHTGIPWRFSRRPNGVRSPAPCLGQDTDRLLVEVLGMSSGELGKLRASGVLE